MVADWVIDAAGKRVRLTVAPEGITLQEASAESSERPQSASSKLDRRLSRSSSGKGSRKLAKVKKVSCLRDRSLSVGTPC